MARRSERRAWWIAFSAVIMALILAGGYFYMLPLKEKVPFVVMADAYTGTSTIARLNEDFLNKSITTSEAINRSNIAHFVLARESYDVAMINLRDWATVLTMSAPTVAAAYTGQHSSSNPNSPYKIYGRNKAVRVRILSIVLIGGGPNTTPKGATVRFQRSLYDKQNGISRPLDSKIATLEFTYKPNLKMDEQYRIENPLGFQVTGYRVDNDYATAPPEEMPDSPSAGAGDTPGQFVGDIPASSASAGELPQQDASPQAPAPEGDTRPGAQAPTTAPRHEAQGERRS